MTNVLDQSDPVSSRKIGQARLGPAFLIYLHIVVCCVSLVYVAQYYEHFHILFDEGRLYQAILVASLMALLTPLFTLARFSFGYFVGFYLYTVILGFLWLNCFSDFHYDHDVAALSAAASIIVFLLPALYVTPPAGHQYTLPTHIFKHVPAAILILAALTLSIGAAYNFRTVSIAEIYTFRNEIQFPKLIAYSIGIVSTTLLPFAFACFLMRKNLGRCIIVLVLLLLFYPVTLSKISLFTPAWLISIALLSKFVEMRSAVVMSLLLPISAGLILLALFGENSSLFLYFGTVNFRMIAIPSSAVDLYNDFFANHDLTYFCQISFMKPIMECPYDDPLSIVMQKKYALGNLNASLFATEGIASVGVLYAPISAFFAGLVVAIGNWASERLPPRFLLISAAIIPLILLNVPLSTALLTNGMALLFLLWYVMPRSFLLPAPNSSTASEA